LLRTIEAAKLQHGPSVRFLALHSSPHKILGISLDVELEFGM